MSDSEGEELHSRESVQRFLGKCGLLVRFRRFLIAFLVSLALAGAVPLVARIAGLDLYSARFLPLLLIPLAVSAVFLLLPIRKYAVELEIDSRAVTNCVFSAFSTPDSHNSPLFPVLVAEAQRAASKLSPFSCINLRLGRWMPAAVLGVLLCFIGIVIPNQQLFGADQVFMRLVEELRKETSSSASGAGTTESDFGKQVERLLADLSKKWEEGDQAIALARLNEILKAAKNRLANGADERENAMVKSGISDAMAKILANGGMLPSGGSSISPKALAAAGKSIGGAFGASLAKASQAVAGSAEQAQLLAEASIVAKRLKNEEAARIAGLSYITINSDVLLAGMTEDEKKKFLDLFSRTGSNTVDNDVVNANLLSGNTRAGDAGELVKHAVESPQYPVRLRSVLIRYASKE